MTAEQVVLVVAAIEMQGRIRAFFLGLRSFLVVLVDEAEGQGSHLWKRQGALRRVWERCFVEEYHLEVSGFRIQEERVSDIRYINQLGAP